MLDLSAGSEEMPTLATDPDGDNELVNEQLEAYEIFNQIKEAYTDFDRAKLEELVPEMSEGRHSNIGTVAFSLGFVLMMILDTTLG